MDLADVRTMLEDANSFARKVGTEAKRGTIQAPLVAKEVLQNKIRTLKSTLSTFKAKKEDALRLAKLKSDFVTLDHDCQSLLHSLEHPTPVPDPSTDSRQVSIDLLPVQSFSYEENKAARFEAVSRDLSALKSLMSDTAELIGNQGEPLNIIETNVDKTVEETTGAGKELKEAAHSQSKQWKWYFGGGLSTVGGLLGLIAGPIGVPIGAALGGMAGAAMGKALEKHDNEQLDAVKFDPH